MSGWGDDRRKSVRNRKTTLLHQCSRSGFLTSYQPSNDAQLDGLAEARQGVAEGNELVGHVALEADVGDGASDRFVVQLLRLIELMAAGVATGVVMAEGGVVLPAQAVSTSG